MGRRLFLVFLGLLVLACSTFLAFWKLDQIDLEASEDIYVSDAVGYMRGDPYLVPRHHLRKPHAPAAPHPFFVPWVQAFTLKYLGLSLFSVRFFQAGSLIFSTALVMLIAKVLFRSTRLALVSALIYTTTPLVVRYSRMAVLDPILSPIQGVGMLWIWQATHNRKLWKYAFAVFAGVALGLSISTKLTGIFFLIPSTGFLLWKWIKDRHGSLIWVAFLFSVAALITFILLNDPYSYFYGWTHFEGRRGENVTLLNVFRGLFDLRYWLIFNFSLVGFGLLALLICSLIQFRYFWVSEKKIFMSLWIMGILSYLMLNPPHTTGLSSEWAYVPLFMPLSLIGGKSFKDIWNLRNKMRQTSRKSVLIVLLYAIFTSTPLVFYGLRYRPIPLPHLKHSRNVVVGDIAVTRIIQTLNREEQNVLVLVQLKRVALPLWMLENNITTEPRYHRLNEYDYIVTDDLLLAEEAKKNIFRVYQTEKNPSEVMVHLLKR